jgi:hypothetical protein
MRSLIEWIVALGVFAGVIWMGLPMVRQWVPPPTSTVTLVESALPALPDGVPSGSQSVPFLMLENGVAVRLGMAEREVKSRSLARATAGPPAVEPGVFDQRITLPFRDGRSRFWVVLEKTGPGREREVTAIYVK